MRRWMHILLDSAAILAALGIPFVCSDTFSRMISGKTDAVTSASVILDAPSGDYLVLVNLDRHQNAENLALWETFFTGTDAPVIYEDISCLTALGDRGGCDMADSFRSRLPENQMKIHSIDGTLLLSKAEHGLFDVIVLSEEFADAVSAETVYSQKYVKLLHVSEVAE